MLPRTLKDFFALVTAHPLSLVGTCVVTASTVLFLSLLGINAGPYSGIFVFMVLPGLFLLGLLLIPFGWVRWRNRIRQAREEGQGGIDLPVIDLNSNRTRQLILVFAGLTVVNIAILSIAASRVLHYTESVTFCGQTCHTVMIPEHTTYQRSPHARVRCADCHIGEGADWAVRYKIDGVRQVLAVAFNTYSRPIPTPVHNLRPARDTCEECHWPTFFSGAKVKTFPHFGNDEANTPSWTVLGVRVGGRLGEKSHGIHWHVDPGVEIRYRSDPSRLTIREVEVQRPDGSRTLFRPQGLEDEAEGPDVEWRVMDCIDCHNRPTHIYRQPESEIDLAIVSGKIDHELPFVRREGLKALRTEWTSGVDAERGIREAMQAFYDGSYPDMAPASSAKIDAAAAELAAIWKRNVFPEMNITWGTYPNHIGHEESPGCWRCHNGEHEAEDGSVISQDCETCHSILAMDEENPEILQQIAPDLARR